MTLISSDKAWTWDEQRIELVEMDYTRKKSKKNSTQGKDKDHHNPGRHAGKSELRPRMYKEFMKGGLSKIWRW